MKVPIMLICVLLTVSCQPATPPDTTPVVDKPDTPVKPPVVEKPSKDIGISSRSYLVGVAGFTPPGSPDLTQENVNEFWDKVDLAGELYAIHVDWRETVQVEHFSPQTSRDLLVGLGMQTPNDWENHVDDIKETAIMLLDTYPQIKYLFIGNEINKVEFEYPDEFEGFISAYREIYDAVKAEHPDIPVFTTFQYERLLGESFIASVDEEPNWGLLTRFEDKMDLFAFTTYPYFQYPDPSDIPEDYYTQAEQYTSKPLAITEVAWMSRESFGGSISALDTQGYASSEEEQIEFFLRFLSLVEDSDFEFIDWFLLYDPIFWENGKPGDLGMVIFDSDGLHRHDGSEKPIWEYWRSLVLTQRK